MEGRHTPRWSFAEGSASAQRVTPETLAPPSQSVRTQTAHNRQVETSVGAQPDLANASPDVSGSPQTAGNILMDDSEIDLFAEARRMKAEEQKQAASSLAQTLGVRADVAGSPIHSPMHAQFKSGRSSLNQRARSTTPSQSTLGIMPATSPRHPSSARRKRTGTGTGGSAARTPTTTTTRRPHIPPLELPKDSAKQPQRKTVPVASSAGKASGRKVKTQRKKTKRPARGTTPSTESKKQSSTSARPSTAGSVPRRGLSRTVAEPSSVENRPHFTTGGQSYASRRAAEQRKNKALLLTSSRSALIRQMGIADEEKSMLQGELDACHSTCQNLESRIEELHAQLEEQKSHVASLRRAKTTQERLTADMEMRLATATASLEEKDTVIRRLEGEVKVVSEKAAFTHKELVNARGEVSRMKVFSGNRKDWDPNRLTSHQQELLNFLETLQESHANQLAQLEASKKASESRLARKDDEIAQLKEARDGLAQTVDSQKAELAARDARIAKLQEIGDIVRQQDAQLEELQRKQLDYLRLLEEAAQTRASLESETETLRQSLQSRDEQLAEMLMQHGEAESMLEGRDGQLQSLRQQVEQLQAVADQLPGTQEELKESQQSCVALHRTNESLRSQVSVLTALVAQIHVQSQFFRATSVSTAEGLVCASTEEDADEAEEPVLYRRESQMQPEEDTEARAVVDLTTGATLLLPAPVLTPPVLHEEVPEAAEVEDPPAEVPPPAQSSPVSESVSEYDSEDEYEDEQQGGESIHTTGRSVLEENDDVRAKVRQLYALESSLFASDAESKDERELDAESEAASIAEDTGMAMRARQFYVDGVPMLRRKRFPTLVVALYSSARKPVTGLGGAVWHATQSSASDGADSAVTVDEGESGSVESNVPTKLLYVSDPLSSQQGVYDFAGLTKESPRSRTRTHPRAASSLGGAVWEFVFARLTPWLNADRRQARVLAAENADLPSLAGNEQNEPVADDEDRLDVETHLQFRLFALPGDAGQTAPPASKPSHRVAIPTGDSSSNGPVEVSEGAEGETTATPETKSSADSKDDAQGSGEDAGDAGELSCLPDGAELVACSSSFTAGEVYQVWLQQRRHARLVHNSVALNTTMRGASDGSTTSNDGSSTPDAPSSPPPFSEAGDSSAAVDDEKESKQSTAVAVRRDTRPHKATDAVFLLPLFHPANSKWNYRLLHNNATVVMHLELENTTPLPVSSLADQPTHIRKPLTEVLPNAGMLLDPVNYALRQLLHSSAAGGPVLKAVEEKLTEVDGSGDSAEDDSSSEASLSPPVVQLPAISTAFPVEELSETLEAYTNLWSLNQQLYRRSVGLLEARTMARGLRSQIEASSAQLALLRADLFQTRTQLGACQRNFRLAKNKVARMQRARDKALATGEYQVVLDGTPLENYGGNAVDASGALVGVYTERNVNFLDTPQALLTEEGAGNGAEGDATGVPGGQSDPFAPPPPPLGTPPPSDGTGATDGESAGGQQASAGKGKYSHKRAQQVYVAEVKKQNDKLVRSLDATLSASTTVHIASDGEEEGGASADSNLSSSTGGKKKPHRPTRKSRIVTNPQVGFGRTMPGAGSQSARRATKVSSMTLTTIRTAGGSPGSSWAQGASKSGEAEGNTALNTLKERPRWRSPTSLSSMPAKPDEDVLRELRRQIALEKKFAHEEDYLAQLDREEVLRRENITLLERVQTQEQSLVRLSAEHQQLVLASAKMEKTLSDGRRYIEQLEAVRDVSNAERAALRLLIRERDQLLSRVQVDGELNTVSNATGSSDVPPSTPVQNGSAAPTAEDSPPRNALGQPLSDQDGARSELEGLSPVLDNAPATLTQLLNPDMNPSSEPSDEQPGVDVEKGATTSAPTPAGQTAPWESPLTSTVAEWSLKARAALLQDALSSQDAQTGHLRSATQQLKQVIEDVQAENQALRGENKQLGARASAFFLDQGRLEAKVEDSVWKAQEVQEVYTEKKACMETAVALLRAQLDDLKHEAWEREQARQREKKAVKHVLLQCEQRIELAQSEETSVREALHQKQMTIKGLVRIREQMEAELEALRRTVATQRHSMTHSHDELESLRDAQRNFEESQRTTRALLAQHSRDLVSKAQEIRNLQDTVDSQRREVAALQRLLVGKENDLQDAISGRQDAQRQVNQLTSLKEEVSTRLMEMREAGAQRDVQVAQLKKDVAELREQLADSQAQLAASKARVRELSDLEQRMAASDETMLGALQRIEELETELGETKAQLKDAQSLGAVQLQAKQELEEEQQRLERKLYFQQNSLDQAAERETAVQQSLDAVKSDLADKQTQLNVAESKLAQQATRITQLTSQTEDLRRQLLSAQQARQESVTQISQLQSQARDTSELDRVQAALQAALQKQGQLQQDLVQESSRLSSARQKAALVEQSLQTTQGQLREATAEADGLRGQLERSKKDLERDQAALSSLQEAKSAQASELARARSELKSAGEQLEAARSKQQVATAQLEEVRRELAEAQRQATVKSGPASDDGGQSGGAGGDSDKVARLEQEVQDMMDAQFDKERAIGELEEKLERATAELAQAQQELEESSERAQALEQQWNKAEREKLALQSQVTELEAQVQRSGSTLTRERALMKADLDALTESARKQVEAVESEKARLVSEKAEVEASARQQQAALEEQLSLLRKQRDTMEAAQTQTQSLLVGAQTDRSQAQQELKLLRSQAEANQSQGEQAEKASSDLQRQVDLFRTQVKEANERALSSNAAQEKLSAQLLQACGEVTELQKSLETAQRQASETRAQLETASAAQQTAEAQVADLRPQTAQLREQLAAAQKELEESKAALSEAQQEGAVARDASDQLTQTAQALEEVRVKLEAAEARSGQLEAEAAKLREVAGASDDVIAGHARTVQEQSERIALLSADLQAARDTIKEGQSTMESLEAQVAQQTKRAEEQELQNKVAVGAERKARQQIAALQAQLDQAPTGAVSDEEVAALREQLQAAQKKAAAAGKEAAELTEQVANLQSKSDSEALAKAQAKVAKLDKKNASLRKRIAEHEKYSAAAHKQLQQYQTACTKLQESVKALQGQRAGDAEVIRELEAEKKAANDKLAEVRASNKDTQATLEALRQEKLSWLESGGGSVPADEEEDMDSDEDSEVDMDQLRLNHRKERVAWQSAKTQLNMRCDELSEQLETLQDQAAKTNREKRQLTDAVTLLKDQVDAAEAACVSEVKSIEEQHAKKLGTMAEEHASALAGRDACLQEAEQQLTAVRAELSVAQKKYALLLKEHSALEEKLSSGAVGGGGGADTAKLRAQLKKLKQEHTQCGEIRTALEGQLMRIQTQYASTLEKEQTFETALAQKDQESAAAQDKLKQSEMLIRELTMPPTPESSQVDPGSESDAPESGWFGYYTPEKRALVLRIGCRKVLRMNWLKDPDPLVAVYVSDTPGSLASSKLYDGPRSGESKGDDQWRLVSKTNFVKSSRNPTFQTPVTLQFILHPESDNGSSGSGSAITDGVRASEPPAYSMRADHDQLVKFCVYDSNRDLEIAEKNLICSCTIKMSELLERLRDNQVLVKTGQESKSTLTMPFTGAPQKTAAKVRKNPPQLVIEGAEEVQTHRFAGSDKEGGRMQSPVNTNSSLKLESGGLDEMLRDYSQITAQDEAEWLKDPNQCTIHQLRGWLTRLNVPLPTTKKPKSTYLKLLYSNHPQLKGSS